MRIHRFFSHAELGGSTSRLITHAPLVNQLRNVFRFVEGDKIVLFDNSGYDFTAVIKGYEKDSVSLEIIETSENKVRPIQETYLFASLVKKDTFEWIAQKATELGVSHIIPIISSRSEKKDLNIERLNKIIIEAAEQSGRGTLPELHHIIDLATSLTQFVHIRSIAWHTQAPKFVTQDIEGAVGAYIGPEGGWSDEELKLFKKHNVPTRSLGPQVLRSETAVIAVISKLVF